MRKYEIMYIVNSSLDEAKLVEANEAIQGVLTSNGAEITNVDNLGLKEFAYEINKMKKGYYVVLTVNAGNEAIAEFDRLSRINPNLVRHLIVKLED